VLCCAHCCQRMEFKSNSDVFFLLGYILKNIKIEEKITVIRSCLVLDIFFFSF